MVTLRSVRDMNERGVSYRNLEEEYSRQRTWQVLRPWGGNKLCRFKE